MRACCVRPSTSALAFVRRLLIAPVVFFSADLLRLEQYIDFSTENALDVRLPNTVQVRTLSKAYGLAGLRVGFAIADAAWVTKADQIRVQFAGNNLT
jgi:hypothetical protein